MTNNQTPGKDFSLRDEMKRRKQAQLELEIEQRKQAKMQGSIRTGPAPAPSSDSSSPPKGSSSPSGIRPIAPPPEAKRTTIQTIVPDAVDMVRRPFQSLSSRQRMMLIGVGAAVLIGVVLVGSLIMAGNTPADQSAATPTLMAQPLSDVDSVLNHFRDVGVTISQVQPYDLAHSQVWHAQAANQFVAQHGAERASYTVFGYDTVQQATDDLFTVLREAKYKKWNIQNFANITLISPPETPPTLQSDMVSHLTQYLYAPYRPFWPTSTPTPTSTPPPATSEPAATQPK